MSTSLAPGWSCSSHLLAVLSNQEKYQRLVMTVCSAVFPFQRASSHLDIASTARTKVSFYKYQPLCW